MQMFGIFRLAMLVLAASLNLQTNAAHKEDGTSAAESGTLWLRQAVPLKADTVADQTTRLMVTGSEGAVTIYFNGQRLVRGRAIDGKTLAFDVTPLVRNGANCIAISMTSSKATQPPKLAASVISGDGKPVPLTNWKATLAAPPVGWQQTDFNDRDWDAADKALIGAPPEDSDITNIKWSRSSGGGRVDSGHVRFRDGDHVVLIGGTFIERAQQYGHLECALNPDPAIRVTFRNLGWSGDTVFADSRGIFDSPEKGYERLIEHVRAEEPTAILVCYGQNEALSFEDDEAGLRRFHRQLLKLHADLATTGAEVIYMTPHPFVRMPAPLPDATVWNERLQQFTSELKRTASELDAHTVDLLTDFEDNMADVHSRLRHSQQLKRDPKQHPELLLARNTVWTDNGMHWSNAGYVAAAEVVGERLTGQPVQSPIITIDMAAKSVKCVAGEVRNVVWNSSDDSVVQFECRRDLVSPFPYKVSVNGAFDLQVTLSGSGSDESAHLMKPSDRLPGFGSKETEFTTTHSQQYQQLVALTVQKNELYFHRWRPQNITYLFGFRKHEQGNNASEIAMYDPLIDELEAKISEARQPQWQAITVRRAETANGR